MDFLSAWEAHTQETTKWLSDLLKDGDINENTTVWSAPDGSYAVGDVDEWGEYDELDIEFTDAGSVAEWLEDRD